MQLRLLKLAGMADMLAERLAQARDGKLGHAELLALLCQDELARRDAAGLARRLAAARFEATCAVEDFDFAYNPDIPAGVIRDLECHPSSGQWSNWDHETGRRWMGWL
jgi:DNA replication protein DnaC